MVTERTRKKIIDALMSLAAERRWPDIALPDIAERAGTDLAALRGAYDTRLAIVEDFARRIDQAVLKDGDGDMADEVARERLFDVLMRRFDELAPYKDALRSLFKSARRDPMLALALCRIAAVSQSWMLTAAGIGTGGIFGRIRGNGLVVAYARVFRVWLGDADPGLARTMSALDRELRRGETALDRLARLGRVLRSPRRSGPRATEAAVSDADAAA